MPESSAHQALVDRAYRYLAARFPIDRGHMMFVDAPTTRRGDKPPRFEGFVPDVFVTSVPTRYHAIGEAKIASDLENDHTTAQLDAFLRHLRIRTGVLVVAVPWTVAATARAVVAAAVERTGADAVETVVLDDGGDPCR